MQRTPPGRGFCRRLALSFRFKSKFYTGKLDTHCSVFLESFHHSKPVAYWLIVYLFIYIVITDDGEHISHLMRQALVGPVLSGRSIRSRG